VLGKEKKVLHCGLKQATRKKPHVIDVALLQNIQNSLMCSMSTVTLQTVGTQI
jgi:hypothetical protein